MAACMVLGRLLRSEAEVREGKSKNLSVMKCNGNDKLKYCGECLSVNS